MEQPRDGVYEVDGTPTDCVNIAHHAAVQAGGAMPDLVVSGINKGYNLGDDVTYSGTVAGALEGGAAGHSRHRGVASSGRAAPTTSARRPRPRAQVAGARAAQQGLAPRTFLNINVPPGKPKGIRVTVQAKRNHVTVVDGGSIRAARRTTGSKKGRTTGSRTTARTTRR